MQAPPDPLEAAIALAGAFDTHGISYALGGALFRPKDIVDLERLIEVQGPALDVAYVRRQLAEMMGESDERVRRWDELTRAVAAQS